MSNGTGCKCGCVRLVYKFVGLDICLVEALEGARVDYNDDDDNFLSHTDVHDEKSESKREN